MAPPADPSLCAVELHPSIDAVAGAVQYLALPNQVVASRAVDAAPVNATVVSSSVDYYSASLVRKAQYRVKAPRFPFDDLIFTVPDVATANLADLITGARTV